MSAEDVKHEEEHDGRKLRRTRGDLLKTAGIVAGAAVAGKLAVADSASAANGQDLVVGQDNTETLAQTTSITTSGAHGGSEQPAFRVTAPNYDFGIEGVAEDYGVVGRGAGGVLGLGTVGGVFRGAVCAVNLFPQTAAGAPAGEAFRGDLAVDSTGVLWLCIANGTPGSWIRVSHGGSRFLATPQRAYDTRDAGKGRLVAGNGDTASPRVIPIGGLFGVPSNALGVFGTLSIVNPSALIFASLWPEGAFPGTANILADPGAFISTSFSVGLNPNDGTIRIGASGATDAIIDVAGYVL
jgi:hypothetical protein